jgi:hypothetical protein
MDLASLFQQITAAITGLVPAPLADIFNQIVQFFTGLLQGIGL